MRSLLLAHQGGWDEFLMVAGPLLFLSLVVWLAARRFKTAEPESPSADPEETFKNPGNRRDHIEEPAL